MSPTTQDTAKLLDLKRRIEGMSVADRLRLVAGLLDHGQTDIAETIGQQAIDELTAARMFPKRKAVKP